MAFQWSAMQAAIFDDVREGTGHTCVEALAGTGKSSTLIEALKFVPKAASNSIVVTSFSTSCVDDLKAKKPPWTVEVRTLNSLGFRALLDNGHKNLKVDKDRVWTILDTIMPPPGNISNDNRRGFNAVRSSAKQLVDLAKSHLADDSELMYELCDQFGIVDEVPEWIAPALQDRFGVGPGGELLGIVFAVLEECKDISDGVVDYNDQLWLPVIYETPFDLHQRLFIDEAQDLSPVQMEILSRSIAGKKGRVTLFGDDNQAIYAWRGAGMGMSPFADRLEAKRLPLSISYRCPRAVIKYAQRLVPNIEAAPDAMDGLVDEIWYSTMHRLLKPGDTVLSRSNADLVRLFMRLLRDRVPVGVQGQELGRTLSSFIAKSGAKSVSDLIIHTKEWSEKEIARRRRNDPDAKIDIVTDKVESIDALCENASTMQAVYDNLDKLLAAPSGGKVLLSSVHKAKGLEWERVFVLDSTFSLNPSFWLRYARGKDPHGWSEKMAQQAFDNEAEIRNLYYVACTRSKRELYLVTDDVAEE